MSGGARGGEPNGNGDAWSFRVRPWTVGASAMTYFAGIATHRAAGPALPIESFEWILRNGSAAVLLVAVVVVIWALLLERRDHEKEREAHGRTRDRLERVIYEAHELASRPVRATLAKLARVLAINNEVIRTRIITEEQASELEAIAEGTPEDGTPLQPRPPARHTDGEKGEP